MNLAKLPFANLRQHLGRTVGFAVLVALLAFVAYGGALVLSSLQNGLHSLEARLGADVLVAPQTAKSQADLQAVLVDGTPGNFYMDRSFVGKIAEREGVEKVSPQYYLATVKASCCAVPLQIIGFDPDTDFSIQPWIARSYADELGLLDIVTGCNVSGAPGSAIKFYGVECRVVARLDETGTALDNAVFATPETVQALIGAAQDLGMTNHDAFDPTQVVSTILVKVADGYSVTDVTNDINLHVRGVTAVQTKAMTAGVSDGMAGTSRVVGVLMAAIWVLVLAVLVVAFAVMGRQRMREFAVLRVVGASRAALSRIVLVESAVVSAIGALVGIAAALLVMLGFNTALENALGLPFLLPGAGALAGYALLALAVCLVAGPAASALSALRLSKVDAGQVLREE